MHTDCTPYAVVLSSFGDSAPQIQMLVPPLHKHCKHAAITTRQRRFSFSFSLFAWHFSIFFRRLKKAVSGRFLLSIICKKLCQFPPKVTVKTFKHELIYFSSQAYLLFQRIYYQHSNPRGKKGLYNYPMLYCYIRIVIEIPNCKQQIRTHEIFRQLAITLPDKKNAHSHPGAPLPQFVCFYFYINPPLRSYLTFA